MNTNLMMNDGVDSFSIVLNLFGIEREDIGIKVDGDRREISVLARKVNYRMKQGFYWVFGVPSDASVEDLATEFDRGVLEITIPKSHRQAVA